MRLDTTSIVYVNNFAHPYLGGGEVHLMHLIRATLEAGMDVHLLAAPGSGVAEQARVVGARVTERPFSARSTMATARFLVEFATDARADIVHGTGYYTNLLARLAGTGAVVNTVHTMADAPLRQNPGAGSWASVRMRAAVERLTTGPRVAVVADSRAIAHSVRAPGAGVRVIYNGVDPEALQEEARVGEVPSAARAARQAGRAVVGTVSRLERVKGIGDLVEAAALVDPDSSQLSVLVAGTGPLAAELERTIATRPELAERVELLGYTDSAPAFIAGLDVFVLPSHSEGFNTTVLEAMALGVPVVATDAGGTREVVEEGVTGRLVAPHDPPALAMAMSEVLGDPEAAARMAASARDLVSARFTVKQMTDAYLDLYGELADGGGIITSATSPDRDETHA